MTIYQMYIDGSSAVFDSPFRIHSKDVFTCPPSDNDFKMFIDMCSDPSFLNYLDKDKPYTTKTLKLNLLDNR